MGTERSTFVIDPDGRILHVRGLPGGIARLRKILSAS